MPSHLLGVLEPSVVLQVNCDTGCPPSVTSDGGEKTRGLRPLPDSRPGVCFILSSGKEPNFCVTFAHCLAPSLCAVLASFLVYMAPRKVHLPRRCKLAPCPFSHVRQSLSPQFGRSLFLGPFICLTCLIFHPQLFERTFIHGI